MPLGLLVPGGLVAGAVPDGQQVVVPGNVAVPGQVVRVLKVAGAPTAAVLDYADCGLWGSKDNWVVVTSSSLKTPDPVGPFQLRTSTSVAHLPKPTHQRSGLPPASLSPCHTKPRILVPAQGKTSTSTTPLCHPLLTNFVDVFVGC